MLSADASNWDQSEFVVLVERLFKIHFFSRIMSLFLTHLSTRCSKGAFRITRCPSSFVRRVALTQTSTPPKPLGHFESNLAGMFLGRSSLKLVRRIWFHQKLGLPWQPNGIFQGILWKSYSLKPLVQFWNNLFLGWPFSKIVREILAAMVGGFLHYMDIKNS